ncbi:MAG: hypothetical protein ACOYNO_10950, partial [Saprospiraceae bacterium]
ESHNEMIGWFRGAGSIWFGVGVTQRDALVTQPFVMKWDAATDSIHWNKPVPGLISESTWDATLKPTPDGGVYVGTVVDGCDYSQPEDLVRLDSMGNLMWLVTTPDDARINYRIWLTFSGDNIVFQTENNRFEYSPNGMFLSSIDISFAWNGLADNSAGGQLAYGNGMIGSSDPFVAIPFVDNVQHATQTPTGEWLLIGQNKVYRLNPGLVKQAEKTVSGLRPFSKVYWAGEFAWITTENNASVSMLLKLDPLTLDVLDTISFDKQYQVTAVIDEPGAGGALWLSGNCNFSRNQTVFLHASSAANPSIVPTRSVALTGIRLEQQPVATVFPYYCPSGGSKITNFYYGKVFAMVTNTGNTPVSRFRINSRFSPCWNICYFNQDLSGIFEIPIMPGDSAEVMLIDNLTVPTVFFNGSTHELCLWTSVPDDALDAIPNDDRYCETFSVTVSEKTPKKVSAAIQVTPNPATDEVTFTLDAPDAAGGVFQLTLSNVVGQPVAETAFSGPSCTVPVGALPCGTYFYHLSNAGGLAATGRLVISR